MKHSTRQQAARDTLQIIEAGQYLNARGQTVSIRSETDYAVQNSRLYRTEDFPIHLETPQTEAAMKWEVTPETTLQAAQRLCLESEDLNPFVLNFASAKNPGGGFLGGAQAQEESLARSSALYPCLTAHSAMYEFNRRGSSCFYSDWMIYSPRVPVFRDDNGALLDRPYGVSFGTSPAVNAGVVRQREPERVAQIEAVNRERARKVLWVAGAHAHRVLVLGAWGCGVFQNDPEMMARIFDELLRGEFAGGFERIVMAVYDRTADQKVYRAFAQGHGG